MKDSIIFDVDGTIWDSTGVVEDAWNEAFLKLDITDRTVTADELKTLFGRPMEEIIEMIFPNKPLEERKKIGKMCFEYEHAFLRKQAGEVYEGMEETLKRLSEHYELYIVSNCQAGYIETVLHATGFGPYFKDHICPGDSGLLKADNIKLIMEKHQLKDTVYVGDTQMDADACKQAGVPIIFAAYGFGTVREPDYVINTPKDLLKLMKMG